MKIRYVCEYCEQVIGEFETEHPEENKLGLAGLTDEEKADIINVDAENKIMRVFSLCDDCVGELEDENSYSLITNYWLH